MLDRRMVNFVGLDNFSFLIFKKPTFWIVVYNSALFAVSFVIIKAFVGFVIAHLLQTFRPKPSVNGGLHYLSPGSYPQP